MLEIEPVLIRSGTALEGYKWKAGGRKDLTSPGLRPNPTLSQFRQQCGFVAVEASVDCWY